ncbi:mechanosensitive ion channel family protein [Pseudonocardia thermophila]|jgi:Small-conductance mechanosensitive channel|uniref:mechanosensitive ion channel family protein n=1 Tax=Pseudonocardia thermophila TaxID=1848 RepID=UPI00248E97CF|nr:mechanosensitive ion channel family protein [Pseudonocardia thermophila]
MAPADDLADGDSLLPFQPPCASDPGSWCEVIYRLTNSDMLARSADTIITKTAHIALTIVIALLVRYLLHRMINRIVAGATSSKVTRLASRLPRNQSTPADSPRSVQRARTIGSVLRSIASAVVLIVASIMVLAEFGVNLGPILASAGIVGVAVGFGAQNLVRDFLSGVFMLLEDQYGVGDIVDLGEASGVVESVGLRVTTVRDVSGTVWYVRNGEILRVGNKSQGYAVAVVDIPVAHSADVAEATELAGRVATERIAEKDLAEKVLGEVQVLGVERIATEAVHLRLTVKVAPGQQFAVQRALNAAITDAFDDAGVPRPAVFPNSQTSAQG